GALVPEIACPPLAGAWSSACRQEIFQPAQALDATLSGPFRQGSGSGQSKPHPQCSSKGVPMRKGMATRERILVIAEAAVLAKGFGATSIDELIAEAGITRSGFFYHFRDKNELARGLLERYERQNEQFLAAIFGRARELSDDPLQSFLIGLTLFAER